ncbi:MAG: response regulator [Alphaproteobacteria bacterium]|nr:response regulator [Alphaproteobacteria bacterium]
MRGMKKPVPPSNPPLPEIPAHVLVAEDNPAVREFITRSLQSVGYQVTASIDGQDALDALTKDKFNVLVTDIVMPNVDGIALAMKAIRLFPDLKIVMISGYAQERMRAHNLDALVHRIIAKPFSLEEICEAVKNALALPPQSI